MTVAYKGTEEYFLGIPARDLTDDEWAALDAPTKTQLLASGLYDDGSARSIKMAERRSKAVAKQEEAAKPEPEPEPVPDTSPAALAAEGKDGG